jgi:hypothetical protein
MKKDYLFILLLITCFAFNATGQQGNFVYADVFYFVKEVNVKQLAGKLVSFEILVKSKPADSLSKPRIYAIQTRKKREDIIAKTLLYATAQQPENGWVRYTVTQLIEPESFRTWFYCAVNGNGEFLFDALIIKIEGENHVMAMQDEKNLSFENNILLKGYYYSPIKANYVSVKPNKKDFAHGKQSLWVIAKNNKPSMLK